MVLAASGKAKVVVTGAGGRTGQLVAKRLAADAAYEPVAVVRDEQSKAKLVGLGVPAANVYIADISKADPAAFAPAFEGASGLIIATSAVPQILPLSMIPVLWAKLTGAKGVMPQFGWKAGQFPEQVDWLGQRAQIDAAKAAGIKRVVLVSSMGGTESNSNLNRLGNGNILQWKRKAEQYLIASGLEYTVIHPGGLIDEAGGQRELLVGVDDELSKLPSRSIPRDDVARLSIECLGLEAARNRAFDAITRKPGEGPVTTDFQQLLAGMTANCDYSINSQW